MINVEVRLATIDDAAAYEGFMSALFAENLDTLPQRAPTPTAEQVAQFFKRRSGEHSALFIALVDGRVIGGIGIGRIDQPNREHASVLGINVANEFRGTGVGRALLEHALSWAQTITSIERIELDVVAHNAAAIHLYESVGFVREGLKLQAMKKDGRYSDLLAMAYRNQR
jgi:putative acetyltransferase